MTRAPLAALAILWALACAEPAAERDALNAAAAQARVDDDVRVTVAGGAVVARTPARGDTPAALRIRAQSLDLRLDIEDRGCRAHTLAVTVTHLPPEIEATWRPFLAGVPLDVTAARAAGGGLLDLAGDPHDPDRTPLGRRQTLRLAPGSAPDIRRFWITTHRGRQTIRFDAAPPTTNPEPAGACVTSDTALAGPLGSAALVARIRLRLAPPRGGYRFAVWGNNAGDLERQARLIRAVNAAAPRFAIITGDLTADGRPDQIRAAVAQLDAQLTIPWFATIGDRDVRQEAPATLIEQLGRTSFAFDFGDLRIITLDSAGRSLSPAGHRDLSAWLADRPLWWSADPPPPVRLVLTHVPPFDPFGGRGEGFNQRLEAGRLLATLARADVPYLITSQLARHTLELQAGVQVLHSGGGGAPMEGDAPHHWLQIHVGDGCLGAADLPDPDCPDCRAGERCAPTGCAPCVTLERVELSTAD